MNGRRAVACLSLLCALALCAVAAPSAMAEQHTTAFTCRKEAKPGDKTKGFEDEHCTKAVTGTKATWVHEFIPVNTVTNLTVTNNETSSKTVAPKLKGKVGAVAYEIEAGGFLSCKEKTWVMNFEFAQKAIGAFCGEFYNVVVKEPAKCEITKKVILLNETGNVETNVTKNGEMFIEFTPPAGKPFTTFEFSGAECKLKGQKVEIKGSAKANVMHEELPLDGATLKFTTEETRLTLEEAAGKAVEFSGTFTPRMAPAVEQPEYPVVLTTVEII